MEWNNDDLIRRKENESEEMTNPVSFQMLSGGLFGFARRIFCAGSNLDQSIGMVMGTGQKRKKIIPPSSSECALFEYWRAFGAVVSTR